MRNLLLQALKAQPDLRNTYAVELQFTEDVLGGQPRDPETMRGWIEAKLNREAAQAEKKGLKPPTEARKLELVNRHLERMFGADSVDETIEEESDRAWTTFFCDEKGPWLGTYQVKAGVREMMSCLGITVSSRGSKQSFQHLMYIESCDEDFNPYRNEDDRPTERSLHIHLYRDGEILTDIDDHVTKTASVNTAMGKRSIIKNHDRILNATIRFLVHVPANLPQNRSTAMLRDREVCDIFGQLQTDGLGCCRAMGHGTFSLLRLERLTNNPWVKGKKRPDSEEKAASAAK